VAHNTDLNSPQDESHKRTGLCWRGMEAVMDRLITGGIPGYFVPKKLHGRRELSALRGDAATGQ